MQLSDKGLALIRRFEGFRANIYADAVGLPTIGYGHLIRANEDFSAGLDADRALALLRNDVGSAERAVCRFILAVLTQSQFDALVSFTYNLGTATLQRSTLRRQLNRGEYGEVPRELQRYVWAGGRKLPGLVRRREAEALLFLS